MTRTIRLNKFLAEAGIASRRGADALVFAGRVQVNGEPATTPALGVHPGKDRVTLDGKPVGGRQAPHYYLLHKPAGIVTTARDPEGRSTVLDLLPRDLPRLYPVGRLDYDSEGLVFLMNDGRLAFRLTHPRYGVPKTYRVDLDAPLPDADIHRLRQGVTLEDGPTAPAEVVRAPGGGGRSLEITLREGRNRQVRRMIEAVGRKVTRLRRIRFGGIELGALPAGSWRPLTHAELLSLRKLTGL